MTHETADIVEAALSMPAPARAELAEKLLESLGDAVDRKEIDKAWAEESIARLRAYDEGKMKGVPLDDVLRRLKAGNTPLTSLFGTTGHDLDRVPLRDLIDVG